MNGAGREKKHGKEVKGGIAKRGKQMSCKIEEKHGDASSRSWKMISPQQGEVNQGSQSSPGARVVNMGESGDVDVDDDDDDDDGRNSRTRR
ncbi:hypothetical protein PAAG_03872 [Paracoccidioides lutzii Pb01]|uniref:Uncharacterized protein n=1 Tax=Paracoccidioides lutzii (strain ATCC MYA-826 / Pb01) TaxID=502779 RepID=C1GZC8_PARBA|nr:hypothetical protein PAAG_03872 [Paracoccidioides lutzii Pb01]EEH41951.1 hypothetical protein PAAG_03872 [Paracoccidioides lutzii Pb01]